MSHRSIHSRFHAPLAVLGAVSVVAAWVPSAAAQTTQRVSIEPSGAQFTQNSSFPQCDLSDDGDVAVFTGKIFGECSTSSPSGSIGIFRRDLSAVAPTTTRVVCLNRGALFPRANQDGTIIAFESYENLLTIASISSQVYVTSPPYGVGSIVLVSQDPSGNHANANCSSASISDGGDRVAYRSQASNLTADPVTFGDAHIYMRDLAAGTTTLVSMAPGGIIANAPSRHPEISGNGVHVVFASSATNLVAGTTTGWERIYARNVATGALTLISKDASGVPSNGGSLAPSISDDGRFVAYHTNASNLGLGGPGNHMVVVHDRDSSGNGVFDEPGDFATFRVSVDTEGDGVATDNFPYPRISGDGTRVIFATVDSYYAPNPTGWRSVWLYDVATGQTRNIHVDTDGDLADGSVPSSVGNVAISEDGMRALMVSTATNLDLASPDTNGLPDVYAHDVCTNRVLNLGGWTQGTGGLKPELWLCGDPAVPGGAVLRLRRARPSSIAILSRGSFVTLPGCGVSGVLGRPSGLPLTLVTTDANGSADIAVPTPLLPPHFVQVAVRDPQGNCGWARSNQLEVP